MTSSHHTRVETLQCAAGSIARIGKEGFLGSLALTVQPFERGPGHKNLATDFKLAGIGRYSGMSGMSGISGISSQHQRNRANGLHVLCHIVAIHTVTSCHRLRQTAINVGERDAQTVVFHLTAYLEILACQTFPDRFVPVAHILLTVGIGQREHRIAMGHLTELGIQVAAHTLRGRIGIIHVRMTGLQVL